MENLIDIVLLVFLVIISHEIIRLRSLFTVVMLTGIYSLATAMLFVVMDAVDVAFTEASVGAGISSMLMVATVALTTREEKETFIVRPLHGFLIVALTGALLIYGTLDMPRYGLKDAPVHTHVAPRYINKSGEEVGVPNIVTSVLASYRGYDTLGETTVIFTAAAGVMTILARRRRKKGNPQQKDGADAS